MPLPPGVRDPGDDFICQRCGRWSFSSTTPCECVEGPLSAFAMREAKKGAQEYARQRISHHNAENPAWPREGA